MKKGNLYTIAIDAEYMRQNFQKVKIIEIETESKREMTYGENELLVYNTKAERDFAVDVFRSEGLIVKPADLIAQERQVLN